MTQKHADLAWYGGNGNTVDSQVAKTVSTADGRIPTVSNHGRLYVISLPPRERESQRTREEAIHYPEIMRQRAAKHYTRLQERLYARLLPSIAREHEGRYVVFENGDVLAVADDFESAARHVYVEHVGRQPLIKFVEWRRRAAYLGTTL